MATFSDAAAQPSKQRIVLVEVDLSAEQDKFNPYEAGIWQWQNTQTEDDIKSTYWFTVFGADCTPNNTERKSIKSFRAGNVLFTEVPDLATLRTQNRSFYYDEATTIIYVHFDDNNPWYIYDSYIGEAQGFCDQKQASALDGCYYNDLYYEPRIVGDLSLPMEKDPLFYGIMGFDSVAVELDNADGFCDDFPNKHLFGQPMRILLGYDGVAYADFAQVFSGVLETPEYPDFSTAILNGIDSRKSLSRSIPARTLSQDDYSYLDDDDHGKEKPLAWGVVRNCPCICLNKTETAATYTYMFLDTTDHDAGALTTVYVEGVEVTPGSSDLSAGTFTLTTEQCSAGKDDVTADFTGFDGITNGLDVIKDMLLSYEEITYIAANYNLIEWAAETLLAENVGLYVETATPMNELIESICQSLQGIFLVQGNGLYTFRSWDADRDPERIISEDEFQGDPEIVYPPEEFLSSAKINYSRDHDENKFRAYTNMDHETEAAGLHHRYEQGEYDTLLTTETDAIAISEEIMLRCKYINPTVSRRILTYPDFEIMDFVVATIMRNESTTIIPIAIYEVVGVDKLTGDISLKWVR